jgi:hypothetical protein
MLGRKRISSAEKNVVDKIMGDYHKKEDGELIGGPDRGYNRDKRYGTKFNTRNSYTYQQKHSEKYENDNYEYYKSQTSQDYKSYKREHHYDDEHIDINKFKRNDYSREGRDRQYREAYEVSKNYEKAYDKPYQKVFDKPYEKSYDRPQRKHNDKPYEKPYEKHYEKRSYTQEKRKYSDSSSRSVSFERKASYDKQTRIRKRSIPYDEVDLKNIKKKKYNFLIILPRNYFRFIEQDYNYVINEVSY